MYTPQNYKGRHWPYGITVLPATRHRRTRPARKAGTRLTYPGRMEGWVDLGGWLHTEMVILAHRRSLIQVLTGPNVEQLRWSRPTFGAALLLMCSACSHSILSYGRLQAGKFHLIFLSFFIVNNKGPKQKYKHSKMQS